MIRMTRLADYGIMLLAHLARDPRRQSPRSSREVAQVTRLPLPTVSKILKALARSGILTALRGSKGGFALTREPHTITLVEIITALDGPIAITDCSHPDPSLCDFERRCPVGPHWRAINRAVRSALEGLTLEEMAMSAAAAFAPGRRSAAVSISV